MNKSDSITNLAAALAKAQGELKPASKDATNPFLKNKFADLGAVIEVVRPTLAKYELSVVQIPISQNGEIGLETILIHSSGEWLGGGILLPVDDEKGISRAQVAGKIITYLRRYALSAVLGVYADEDTDGNTQNKPTSRAVDKKTGEIKETPAPQWTRDVQEWAQFAEVAKTLGLKQEQVKEILQVTSFHNYKSTRKDAEAALHEWAQANAQPA